MADGVCLHKPAHAVCAVCGECLDFGWKTAAHPEDLDDQHFGYAFRWCCSEECRVAILLSDNPDGPRWYPVRKDEYGNRI